MRIILFTGKGGVGKTTVSAATALRCAALGYRTIIVSTDPAHSLGDSFDRRIGPEPTLLQPRLWGQEIDLLHQMERHWGKVQKYLAALFAWRGMDGLVAEETSILPGMEELASLMQIAYLADSGDYDVVVVDMAPTGATLQLLAFPEMAVWYIEKIFPFERKAMRIARPLMRTVTDMPLPEEGMLDAVEELVKDLNRLERLVSNPDISSVRLVLNPEKMVIKEAQRAFTYLNLYNLPTDAVISNRYIPDEVTDSYFDDWKRRQLVYNELIDDSFAPLPIFKVPLLANEVVGLDALQQVAEAIYGQQDPTTIFYHGQAQQVLKEGSDYLLLLPLPLLDKHDIQLHRGIHDELIVRIGNWKRHISLPQSLISREIAGARYRQNQLEIRFRGSH
ncbi:MAG: TRC40/GET3/ArsA family transport-energizing ATPase [Chloroflexi bacterium]|nr:TRC40/GET3/ArsA family transport-energizing ATPase [Chloroflexota bacterium]